MEYSHNWTNDAYVGLHHVYCPNYVLWKKLLIVLQRYWISVIELHLPQMHRCHNSVN